MSFSAHERKPTDQRKNLVELQIEAIFHPEINNQWMSFVGKSQQLNSQWKSRECWPYECYAATRNSVKFIQEKEKSNSPATFQEVSEFLAKERANIAKKFNEKDYNEFGSDRSNSSDNAYTHIAPPRYTDFVKDLRELYNQLIAAPAPDEKYIKLKAEYDHLTKLLSANKPNESEIERTIRITFLIEELAECRKEISKKYPYFVESPDRVYIYYKGISYSALDIKRVKPSELNLDTELIQIIHSPSSSISQAFKTIEPYFKAIKNAPKPATEEEFKSLIKQIGFVAWHHFQAMPYHRGNAAITEMLIRNLLMLKDIKLPVYNQLIICDLKAIFTPDVNKFSDDFYNYFDWSKNLEERFQNVSQPTPKNAMIFKEIISFFNKPDTKYEDCVSAFNYIVQHYLPILNKHQNPNLDKLFKIKNTPSFENLWTSLAEITMQKLRKELQESKEPSYAHELLENAKKQKIFNGPPGKFGFLRKSPWLDEINKLIYAQPKLR